MRHTIILPTLLAVASACAAAEVDPHCSAPIAPNDKALLRDDFDAGKDVPQDSDTTPAKPDQATADAAVARARQGGVAALSDADLAIVANSGVHALWRRAVSEQHRRSGDTRSAADNDMLADVDAFCRGDRIAPSGPHGLFDGLAATFALVALRQAHGDVAALSDADIAALDGIRTNLRDDIAQAVDAAVERRPAAKRLIVARWLRDSGYEAEARELAQRADEVEVPVHAAGWLARDWQGSTALLPLDYGLSAGLGFERFAIRDEPVTVAVEGVVQATLPVVFAGGMSIGPAATGRLGVADGRLMFGWDATAHAEVYVCPGVGATLDLGVGQRKTREATSRVEPEASVGLAVYF